jgi:LacI family transcriptional regulator
VRSHFVSGIKKLPVEITPGDLQPRDVSLVGFDDVPFATDLTPPLTTVRVPYEELGRSAVRPALDREERGAVDDHLVLSTRLVIRQSVRRVE